MWVIYNKSTGNEIDRVETAGERDELLTDLADEDVWGYTYGYRYEA